jgi:hypothetical protein
MITMTVLKRITLAGKRAKIAFRRQRPISLGRARVRLPETMRIHLKRRRTATLKEELAGLKELEEQLPLKPTYDRETREIIGTDLVKIGKRIKAIETELDTTSRKLKDQGKPITR